MKVQLDKAYPMPGSADAAWAVLGDLERVAGCMPGAKITERLDATHYKGTVAVRFGPANMSFRGEVEILARDDTTRHLHLSGKGTDTTGTSGAGMDLKAFIEPGDEANCTLKGTSEVSMSGKAATFGARMAVPVAEQVLKQFAALFAAQVEAEQARRGAPPTGGEATATGPAAEASEAAEAAGAAGAAGVERPGLQAAGTAAGTVAAPAPAAAPPAIAAAPGPPPAALNGTALLWAVFKSWLRGLCGGRG
jgi:carbon monoxide dehydrogenase subunit G